MIKACIFDLDGTLMNTLTSLTHFVNVTLSEFGYDGISEEKCRRFVGNGAKCLIERAMADVGADEKEFDKMLRFFIREYNKDTSYLTIPYDGIPEMLAAMKTDGIQTAVLSNKPDYATGDIVKNFLGDLIDVARGAVDGVELKPSCEGLDILLKELGVEKDECIYVGDTAVDMETGKKAGIFTIGVLWGFREREELEKSGADMIVSDPDEIYRLLKEK